jgi:hypothetical protein
MTKEKYVASSVKKAVFKKAIYRMFFLMATISFLNNFTITEPISLKFGLGILDRFPSLCAKFYKILYM